VFYVRMSPPLAAAFALLTLAAEPSAGDVRDRSPARAPELPPDVVPRVAWDANPPSVDELAARGVTRYPADLAGALDWIVVHHSDFADAPGPAVIKRYHLEVSGFSDIGYHFVISPDGTVYEARPLELIGAHAGVSREQVRSLRALRAAGKRGAELDPAWRLDPDYGAIGIVLDGHFFGHAPSRAQRKALRRLTVALMERFDIPRGHVVTHREVKSRIVEASGRTFAGSVTVCPGDDAQTEVAHMRLLLP
jgi:hypothetical protein